MADDRQREDDVAEEWTIEERTVETTEHTVEVHRGVPEPEGYPYEGDLEADVARTTRPTEPASPPVPPPAPGEPTRQRNTLAIVLGAILLLLAAGLAAWLLLGGDDTKTVPSVTGLTLDQAVQQLEDEGFEADTATQESDAPEGTVVAQDPSAGAEAEEGSTVLLGVSGGPGAVTVPNAVGLPEAEARDRLVDAGLQVESTGVFSQRLPGTVTSQDPAAGSEAEPGTTVSIEVSKGTGLVQVPNVVGLTRGEALAELSNVQLEANVVEVPSDEPVGIVVAQNPVGGQAQQGSTVRLNVSAGR
jgi:serine/threonine-protein kinase